MVTGTLRLRRSPDGQELWCHCEGAALKPLSKGSTALILMRFREKQAEADLKANESRFTMFTENLPGLAWIKDLDGRYVYANDAATKAFRTTRAELYGSTDDELFPLETARQFKENDRLALAGGTVLQTVETLEQDDGVHHSLVSKFPIFGPDGETVMVGGVAIDITERKRSEDALQQSEARYRTLFETAQDGIMIVNEEGYYVEVNESLCRILKAPRERLVGAHFSEFIPPAFLKEAEKDFADLKTFSTFAGEFPMLAADGQTVELEWISRANFVPGLHFCVAREITERKRAQEELQRSEEKYRGLLENANDIIYSHDLAGNYLTINRAGVDVTGYTRTEILGGLNIAQVVVPEHLELAKEMTRRKFTDPSPTVYEVDIFTKDRRRLTLEVSTRIAFRDGQPVLVEGIARDITERKRVEREREELLERERQARRVLEEASRLKDEFLATVSHELRTPLTAILGWAHMLLANNFDEAARTNAIGIIERNARSQKQIIEDILDVSRIITGKIRIDVRTVELVPVIEAAREAVETAASAKGIIFQFEYAFEEAAVTGDPDRLQQVVWNLLSNAVKFTPRGGRVSLRLARAGSHAEITVSDTGEGISPEFLPRVFDRFSQADGSITRAHGGVGLGLAIVRHLVELHGGRVRAVSAGEGLGSAFTVSLPLKAREQDAIPHDPLESPRIEQSESPSDDAQNLSGLKVLIVDDEADTLDFLKAALSMHGAKVVRANNAAEALDALEKEKPDLLISDLGMPDVDGYELIRRVRELDRHIPAVALTAYARGEDRRRALASGYQAHLAKPVTPAELIGVVASLGAHRGKQ